MFQAQAPGIPSFQPHSSRTVPVAATPLRASSRWVIVGLAASGIVVAFMQTLVVPIVAGLPDLLDASPANASWAITATLLTSAVVTPVGGRLGDLYGKRPVFLISLAMLVVGSVIAAVGMTLPTVIVGRGIQGFAMGVIPLGISIMRDVLPPRQASNGIALMSTTLGMGGAIGLPVAAVVAQRAGPATLFWIAAGLGVLAFGVAWLLVPTGARGSSARFDVPGTVGLAIGLVCLLLAITKGTDWGWASPTTLGMFTAAALVLIAWTLFELRTRDPLVDIRSTANRPVLLTNLASVAIGFAMYASQLVLPQLLQSPTSTGYGMGLSMIEMGLCMVPGGLVMAVLSPVSGRLNYRYGPRRSLTLGATVIAAAYGAGIVFSGTVTQIALVFVAIGAGIGLSYSAMPSLIMAHSLPSESGSANGVNTLMRSLGTSTSSAVMAAVLASDTTTVGALVVPAQASFQLAFGCSAVVALVAVILALTTGPRVAPAREPEPSVPCVAGAGAA